MSDAKQTSLRHCRSWAEPYKIKVLETLKITTRAEREQAAMSTTGYDARTQERAVGKTRYRNAYGVAQAGYNTFLLRFEDMEKLI
ncbi:hypothetical protein LC653_36365 [Nostoc sp. CHAB 5784]|uniref:hypothetical protein n=1 Tax=Nostoc mirabile TaxID=2907820 RepID=UPI001E4AE3BA|nr:hypothetical protein [Nostoc mirabile]MCC5669177.1 hypothetical protein [Nostoc mirabile CHAB5784]